MPFSFRRQLEAIDCGATCLQMISAYYGKKYDLGQLREWCSVSRTGVNIKDITETSKQIGLEAVTVKATINALTKQIKLPCILHWPRSIL